MGIIEKARALRSAIDTAAAALPDEVAVGLPELYREWDGNSHSYAVGDRVKADGVLYKTLQAHTSQPDWNPADAPSLFAEVLPGQDGTEIGVWKQPDSTNGYKKGNRVHYPTMSDPIYESIYEGLNIWSPEGYPQGWRLVEE